MRASQPSPTISPSSTQGALYVDPRGRQHTRTVDRDGCTVRLPRLPQFFLAGQADRSLATLAIDRQGEAEAYCFWLEQGLPE